MFGKAKLKTISLVVASLTAVSLLAGCGGSDKAASGDIKVGVNVGLTGGIATFGKSYKQAVELAFAQQNEKGGVLGKKLVAVIADNKSEAAESAAAATKLITQDKVIAVTGPIASSNVMAASQICIDNKVPLLTGTGTNPKITVGEDGKVKDFIFRGAFIDPFQGQVMANFAVKTLKAKTAAIYVDQSSDYSKGLQKFFKETFEKLGGKIVAEEAFLQKDQDFKATLTKIKGVNPDVIFVPAYYEEVGKIVRQARELGITAVLLGTDGWDSPKLPEIAGAATLNNTYFSNHYSPEDKDPKVVEFVAAYKKAYGQDPDALAALGYDAALMLIDALQRAGSADPIKLNEALKTIKDLKGVTGIITLNASHDPVKSAVVMEYKEGKQVFKEKVNP